VRGIRKSSAYNAGVAYRGGGIREEEEAEEKSDIGKETTRQLNMLYTLPVLPCL